MIQFLPTPSCPSQNPLLFPKGTTPVTWNPPVATVTWNPLVGSPRRGLSSPMRPPRTPFRHEGLKGQDLYPVSGENRKNNKNFDFLKIKPHKSN